MKLQTLLLPTGEFILVGSECKPLPPEQSMSGFRDQIGAAGILFVEQSVEVEDALVDENARRHDYWLEVTEDDSPDERWRDLGVLDEKDSFSFTTPDVDYQTFNADDFVRAHLTPQTITIDCDFDADGDQNLLAMLYGGAEFSPAGLVKPSSAQEKIELGHYVLTGCPRPRHIEVDSAGVAEVVGQEPVNPATSAKRDSPGTIGRFPDTGPQSHDVDLAEVTVSAGSWECDEPDPLAPGTPVKVIGPTLYPHRDDELIGQTGVVTENEYENTPEGCVCVTGLVEEGWCEDSILFYPRGSVQPIPVDLEAAVTGARKKIVSLDDSDCQTVVLSVN